MGPRLELRPLRPEDVSQAYVDWMNDPETVRFTEARHAGAFSPESVRAYVAACEASVRNHLLGIFERRGGRHVGNIKIGPVDPDHLRAGVGLIIAPDRWGRGYATEAIGLAVDHAFGALGLHKLTAGVIQGNAASLKAFEKNGFAVEGRLAAHNLVDGAWRDVFKLGLVNPGFGEGRP